MAFEKSEGIYRKKPAEERDIRMMPPTEGRFTAMSEEIKKIEEEARKNGRDPQKAVEEYREKLRAATAKMKEVGELGKL